MRHRLLLVWSSGLLTLLLGSCADSPTTPRLGVAYVLATMDGQPVPAAYDSTSYDGHSFFYRVTGRSVEFLSRDSAQYAQATDAVERLPGGEYMDWAGDCTSLRVAYRRAGDRIILTIDPNVFLPAGSHPRPVSYDTLEVAGSVLVQWRREGPTIDNPVGRSWRLEYREGKPDVPVC